MCNLVYKISFLLVNTRCPALTYNVLKTVKVQAFWGSNPYLRAKKSARLLGITECLAFFLKLQILVKSGVFALKCNFWIKNWCINWCIKFVSFLGCIIIFIIQFFYAFRTCCSINIGISI